MAELTEKEIISDRPIIAAREYDAEIINLPKKEIPAGKIMLALLIFSAVGLFTGLIFRGIIFDGTSDESLVSYLKMRINGGFFANLSTSFLSSAIWIFPLLLCGFCAVAQPIIFILPLLKGIGTGIIFSHLLEIYGISGLPTFLLLFLPSFTITSGILAYQGYCSFKSSGVLLSYVRGNSEETHPKSCFKAYLYRTGICTALCLLSAVIDSIISLFADKIFII